MGNDAAFLGHGLAKGSSEPSPAAPWVRYRLQRFRTEILTGLKSFAVRGRQGLQLVRYVSGRHRLPSPREQPPAEGREPDPVDQTKINLPRMVHDLVMETADSFVDHREQQTLVNDLIRNGASPLRKRTPIAGDGADSPWILLTRFPERQWRLSFGEETLEKSIPRLNSGTQDGEGAQYVQGDR